MKMILLTTVILVTSLPLTAQDKQLDSETQRKQEQQANTSDNPFISDEGYYSNKPPGEWRKKADIISTQIRVEWLAADTQPTVHLLDEWKPTADASVIRKRILALNKTTIFESLLSQVDVGEKSTTETILEKIYPTEYQPAGIGSPPETLKHPDKENELLDYYAKLIRKSGLAPTAFETRNTGLSLELALEPISGNKDAFDLSLNPEKVMFIGMQNFAPHEMKAEMPRFATVRANTTIRVKPAQWRLAKIQPALDPKTGQPNSKRRLLLFIRLDRL